ncbi:MAG TPA: type II toxin-antitoxin system VapC family toxin [Thiolinea sp.]|nr:type II toxin-antitoxin system VapC family toxin [Thiolinea sp.]
MVLDASALLALLQNETGSAQVHAALPKALISSVNWSEVIQKLSVFDPNASNIRLELEATGLKIVPFSAQHAELCAGLWVLTKPYGLSLGDRACIALGMQKKQDVMTADKIWEKLNLPIKIEVIR